MITVYHNLQPEILARLTDAAACAIYRPALTDLELVAVLDGIDDLAEAFDHVIHRDGENWTADMGVTVFGHPRARRSTQEGDVFVASDGTCHLVLPVGFRALRDFRLPFLP